MFRFSARALLLPVLLAAAGCDSRPSDTAVVSQAIAAPAATKDKGWQSSVSPTAVDDTATNYE